MQTFNRTLLLSAALLVAAATSAQSNSASELLAGSGVRGFADGAARSASFAIPIAVAVGNAGEVYVADAGAQRIRVIRGGTVTTLAGGGDELRPAPDWPVAGAFKDGTAQESRFSRPSGVAVGRNGSVYIADSQNHCIRVIKDTTVLTFAGACGTSVADAAVDGPAKTARFGYVRQLALDADGNLFVADFSFGVRRITPDGTVSTLPLPTGAKKTIMGVAVWGSGKGERVFASDREGLIVINLATSAAVEYRETAEGQRRFGIPDALVALGPREVAFTDARNHQIRFFRDESPSGGIPGSVTWESAAPADGAFRGSGYAEGPPDAARFDQPRGIAVAPNGDIVIADTGSRRIRLIRGFDARIPREGDEAERAGGQHASLALVGGSYVFYDTVWERSLPGLLEARLPRAERVAAFRYKDRSLDSMRSTLASALHGRPSVLIWQMTTADAAFDPATDNAAFRAFLTEADRNSRAANVRLLFVTLPVGTETGSNESVDTALYDPQGVEGRKARARYAAFRRVIGEGGRSFLDLESAMVAQRSRQTGALFGAIDPHLTDEGCRFVASRLAIEMEHRKW